MHACEILDFSPETPEKEIVAECYKWQKHNCDPYEHGFSCDPTWDDDEDEEEVRRFDEWEGPKDPINFTSRIYDTREEAYKYLNGTFGHYRQTAVRFNGEGGLWWAVACETHC